MRRLLLLASTFCALATAPAFSQEPPKSVLPDEYRKGYVLAFFLRGDCPCNEECIPLMNDLKKQLGGTLRVIAVVNEDKSKAENFIKTNKVAFPGIGDPGGKWIMSAGGKNSLDFALLLDGEPQKVWLGINRRAMESMAATFKEKSGKALKLDLAKYPRNRKSGCPFDDDVN